MPQVHFVKKARKSPGSGIKKGESYYWWKFRYGGRRVSKVAPRPSQLTQSEFLSTVYGAQEELEDAAQGGEASEIIEALQSAVETVRSQGEECEGKADNMESAFSGGSPTIDLLRGRSEKCEEVSQALEELLDGTEELKDEDDDEALCTCGHERQQHTLDTESDTYESCEECDCVAYEYDRDPVEELVAGINGVDWSFE